MWKMFHLWVYCVIVLVFLMGGSKSEADLNSCIYKPLEASPEVLFVNMDKSTDRKHSIERHFSMVGLKHRRIKGLTLDDIYMPKDIGSTWDKYESKTQTLEIFPRRDSPEAAHLRGYTHIMAGLVGRAKKNKLKEIGCTSSHLEAMRQAVHFNRTNSRYAVITEDDVQIPFNIDFEALAASAPEGFGILQLFNSNEESMESTWRRYVDKGVLWTPSVQKQAASFWSTCANLIDREVMRPIVDRVAALHSDGFVHLKIIAGIKQPCRPKFSECCVYQNESMTFRFVHEAPCVWAAKGFQADSFLYALAPTYVLSVPLITNGAGGNQSTFHQDHVENIHASAFARQREYINQLIAGTVPLPPFVNNACRAAVPTGMTLVKADKCVYADRRASSSSVAVYWLNQDEHYRQRDNMNTHLSEVVHRQQRRVSALNASDLFLPQDIQRTFETRFCTSESESVVSDGTHYSVLEEVPPGSRTVVISGLCGRGKGQNNLHDLAATASHLIAIHQAVHQGLTASRFALIVEDDTHMPFDIDFDALAASAPPGFGILRLLTSHEAQLDKQWARYQRNHSDLWSADRSDRVYDDWATKAYLVDKAVMRPVVDAIVREAVLSTAANPYRRLYDLKVLAGLATPCAPMQCCGNSPAVGQPSGAFVERAPCVLSRTGFQSERFLFRLAPTYVLNVPLVTANLNNVHSTLKGDGAVLGAAQWSSLKRLAGIINSLIDESVPLPPFAKVGCKVPL